MTGFASLRIRFVAINEFYAGISIGGSIMPQSDFVNYLVRKGTLRNAQELDAAMAGWTAPDSWTARAKEGKAERQKRPGQRMLGRRLPAPHAETPFAVENLAALETAHACDLEMICGDDLRKKPFA